MTPLDWLIVVILGLSVILAVEQGLVFEVLTLGGVAVGYLLAAWNYSRFAPRFLPYVKSAPVAELASFLTIFFIVLLVAGIAGRIARWSAKAAGLRWFDRVLGGVFGLARGVAIVSVIVLGFSVFAPASRVVADSRLGNYFLVVARGAVWVAPSSLRQRLQTAMEELRKEEAPTQKKSKDGSQNHFPAPGRT